MKYIMILDLESDSDGMAAAAVNQALGALRKAKSTPTRLLLTNIDQGGGPIDVKARNAAGGREDQTP